MERAAASRRLTAKEYGNTHAAVRERRLDGGSLHCVVYSGLVAGEYTIWADDTTPGGTATVIGGRVTELDWTSIHEDVSG